MKRHRLIQVGLGIAVAVILVPMILVIEFDLPDWASSLAVPLLGLGIVLAVADRTLQLKPEPGRCPECGYQLAGLRSKAGVARCPECGATHESTPGDGTR